MDNAVSVFESVEFGSVRTVTVDGEVMFVGSDVAKALGYSNPPKALSDHCKGITNRYIGVVTRATTKKSGIIVTG